MPKYIFNGDAFACSDIKTQPLKQDSWMTVDQVERNNRIANGLRKATLQDKEAVTWMQDL